MSHNVLAAIVAAAGMAAIIAWFLLVAIPQARRDYERISREPRHVVEVIPRGPVVIPGLDDTASVPVVLERDCEGDCGHDWCPFPETGGTPGA